MWFCGGHAVCLTGNDSGSAVIGDSARIQKARIAWFARYLKGDHSVETGPAFEWIDENGDWHESGGYPLNEVGTLEGTGSGQLPLAAQPSGAASGVAVYATPSPVSVAAPIDTPDDPVNVVGEPKLEISYSGVAAPAQTFVYAQIVDLQRNIVVNNQATPVPVTLDGQQHELTIPLERVASLSTPAGYELQIVPGTSVYDLQRSAGVVDISSAHVTLPVSEPVPVIGAGADCSSPQKGTPGADHIRGGRRRRRDRRRPGARPHQGARRRRLPRRPGRRRPPRRRRRRRPAEGGPWRRPRLRRLGAGRDPRGRRRSRRRQLRSRTRPRPGRRARSRAGLRAGAAAALAATGPRAPEAAAGAGHRAGRSRRQPAGTRR